MPTSNTILPITTCSFRRWVIRGIAIEESRLGFELEFTAKAAKLNVRVIFPLVHWTESRVVRPPSVKA